MISVLGATRAIYIRELSELEKFAKEYSTGIDFFAIIEEKPPGSLGNNYLSNFVKKYGVNSVHVLIDSSGNVRKDYRVSTIPTIFIVNRNGIIVHHQVSGLNSADSNSVARIVLGDLAGKPK